MLRYTVRMMALLIILVIAALLAVVVARLAASPLFRCLRLCFDSWAEASRAEPLGGP